MVSVRLHWQVVIRGYLTVVAGSSIHVNAEKSGAESKEGRFGRLKRTAGREQDVMAHGGSFYVYAAFVRTIEEQAQMGLAAI